MAVKPEVKSIWVVSTKDLNPSNSRLFNCMWVPLSPDVSRHFDFLPHKED
jgi:hypothetical protein